MTRKFLYAAVRLPSREVLYFSESAGGVFTGDITRAKVFPDKSYIAPLRALKFLDGEIEHKWVELQS